MTCKECKERLYPSDPEKPGFLHGLRMPPICDFCSYKDSSGYLLEKMEEIQESPRICAIKNCPIWKVVAELQQKVINLGCEVTHIHAGLHEKKATEKKEEGW